MNVVRKTLYAAVAVAAVAAGAIGVAAPASAATSGICAYEYQAHCVTWLTSNATCDHIYETNQPKYRKDACTIFVATGHVYVEG